MENAKRKLRSIIASATTAFYLAGSNINAQPISGSVEAMGTSKNLTSDTKLSIDLNKRLNLFTRNRTGFNYKDNNKVHFTVIDFSYNWGNGLGVLYETQLTAEQEPNRRAGLQYFGKTKSLSLYAGGTAGIAPEQNGEITLRLRYSRPLKQNLDSVLQAETITDLDKTGITFAVQRCKAGLNANKSFEAGFELDIKEIPGKDTQYTKGGYISYKF